MSVLIKIAQKESFTSKESERFYGFFYCMAIDFFFFLKTCTDSSHQRRFFPHEYSHLHIIVFFKKKRKKKET